MTKLHHRRNRTTPGLSRRLTACAVVAGLAYALPAGNEAGAVKSSADRLVLARGGRGGIRDSRKEGIGVCPISFETGPDSEKIRLPAAL